MYGFYLFFDFAGYSLMAMGASYCFGIKTPRNFRAPFLALDVRDFWDRWHMTLSTWLRDFVFMRAVKSATRRKLFKDRLQTACAGYMANFMLMGAWHGLTVDYLVYGAYYGVLMGATDVYQKKSSFHKKHKKKKWYKVLQWFVTINLVMLGMAIFSGQMHTEIIREERDADLFEEGLLDSMAAIELLVAIETEFGVTIAPTAVEREEMNSVNKIIYQVQIRYDAQ